MDVYLTVKTRQLVFRVKNLKSGTGVPQSKEPMAQGI
jgi:hypothetical protein